MNRKQNNLVTCKTLNMQSLRIVYLNGELYKIFQLHFNKVDVLH